MGLHYFNKCIGAYDHFHDFQHIYASRVDQFPMIASVL